MSMKNKLSDETLLELLREEVARGPLKVIPDPKWAPWKPAPKTGEPNGYYIPVKLTHVEIWLLEKWLVVRKRIQAKLEELSEYPIVEEDFYDDSDE